MSDLFAFTVFLRYAATILLWDDRTQNSTLTLTRSRLAAGPALRCALAVPSVSLTTDSHGHWLAFPVQVM
jgi:hypothetical protein